MKQIRRNVYSALLSMSIVGSSVLAPVYAIENKDFIPVITATDSYDAPTFMLGELSEKSEESPEKIVEKYYNRNSDFKDFSYVQNNKFKNSMGRTVISTTQTLNGVRVYGTEQNYHVNDNGVIECVAGSKVDDIENKVISKSFYAKYTTEDVLNAIEKDLGFTPQYTTLPQPEIILYPINGMYNYVYEAEIKFFYPYYKHCTYYIDANNLSIIDVNNHIHASEEPASGVGTGQLGKTRQLQIVKSDNGNYLLKNPNEKFGTYLGAWVPTDRSVTVGALFSEPDNNFDSWESVACQDDAVDAHYNVTKVSRFFRNAPFYRNGNDDKGSDMIVCIVNSRIANAYGDENYIELHSAHYNGNVSSAYCLDIIAHEYTHGVLYSEGLSGQQKETLAIHEGVADVFGVLAEYFISNEYTEDPFVWLHGEDSGEIQRDCANPVIDDYNEYKASNNPSSYEGGGVITKAASLMARGGTHNGITVNSLGYAKLAHIFYNAINDGYITQETSMKQFANYAVQAARLLYGPNSQACKSTKDAFVAVGLLDDGPTNLSYTTISSNKIKLSWNMKSGKKVGIYAKIPGTKDTAIKLATTSNSEYTINTLNGSVDYCVAYVDESDNRISEYSNAINFEILTQNAPTNFRITYRGCLTVQFSWNGTTGDKFAVYRKISGSDEEFVKVGETTNNQITVETFLGKCDFKVAIVGSNGIRFSPFSNVYSIESYLDGPTNFKKVSSTGTKATFSWNHCDERASRYAIYKVKSGTSNTPAKVGETRETSIEINVESGYDYQVAIIDLEGNRMSHFSDKVR